MRRSPAPWCLAFAAVTSLAAPSRADEPLPPDTADPERYPVTGAGSRAFVFGAATTAFWYGAALGFSYLWPDAPGAEALRIPVAGPVLALAETGCARDDPGCGTFGVVLRAVLTTIDGVGQIGGVGVMLESLFLTTRPPAAPRPPRDARAVEWRALPVAGEGSVGFAVLGRF